MTIGPVIAAAERYKWILEYRGHSAECSNIGAPPIEQRDQLNHALWLIGEITDGFVTGIEAERQLGFIQGVLWANGVYSIADKRDPDQ